MTPGRCDYIMGKGQVQGWAHFGHYLLATYFGGSANEFCEAIALDDAGNVYVTGYTTSADFPTTRGSYNTAPKSKSDVFIVKFDKELKKILASTIIGGGEDECAYSIVYDKSGYVFLAGYTGSKDFPTTTSAFCTKYNGGSGDAFILKMDRDLKKLVASTFLGGGGNEDDWRSPEIVQDQAGHIYIAGITHSADFPITRGAFNEKYNGGDNDGIVLRLDKTLAADVHEEFHDAAKRDQLIKARQFLSANVEWIEFRRSSSLIRTSTSKTIPARRLSIWLWEGHRDLARPGGGV